MAIHEVKSNTGTGYPATRDSVANAGSGVLIANSLGYLAAGKMVLVATGGTALTGVMLNDTTNANDPVTYVPFLDGVTFLIDTSAAITIANVGISYGVTVTTGVAVLNISDTSTDCLIIDDLVPSNTSQAWVRCLSTSNSNLVGG